MQKQHHKQEKGEERGQARQPEADHDTLKNAIRAALAELSKSADQKISADTQGAGSRKRARETGIKKSSEKNSKDFHPRKGRRVLFRDLVGGLVLIPLALAFLAANIAASQVTVPRYRDLVENDRSAWIELFKAAEDRGEISILSRQYPTKYQQLRLEINRESQMRKDRIAALERDLAISPQSRDILYALSLLYRREGDLLTANSYLERARLIDPQVGRE